MMNADQDGAVPRLVPAPPLPRLTAFALDAVTYLIIPALLLPLGLLLIRHGVMLSSVAINAIGLVLVIAPATAWASWREARPRGATPGKRLLRLGVLDETTEALVPASRSLARNMIRIALPWELGHTVALGYAYTEGSNVPVWLWLLTAIIYGWLIINLILLIISRKPLHDRLAGTIVVRNHELITD
jgi:uncharacterized RDD family membrane protein YckC